MFVLYVDPYHLGDPLFMTGLARDLRARMDAGGSGLVIVIGAGEEGERAIESLGAEPRREAGALVIETQEQAGAVERAARDLHRRLVETLNEAGLSAVRVTASDRGLVRPDGSPGKTRWLAELAGQRAVPVVLSLVSDGTENVRELDPARMAASLGVAIGDVPVIVIGTPPATVESAPVEVAGASVPDAEALRRIVSEGSRVLVARRTALRQPGVPFGLRVEPAGA